MKYIIEITTYNFTRSIIISSNQPIPKVCANEGHRGKDNRRDQVKRHQAETRTDCEVRMCLVKDKETNGYKVYDLNLERNHDLHLPKTFHLMVLQRKFLDL
jgi:hypothetical protein